MSDETDDDVGGEEGPVVEVQNAAEPKQIRRQRDSAARRARESLAFWQMCLRSEVGRRELWGVLQNGDAFGERYALNPTGRPDPLLSWRHAGEQRHAFRLFMTWLGIDPESTLKMLRENDPQLRAAEKRRR